ncbi:ACP S-malonyltransferase [Streptomyces griseorubiginosus]|uniref:ACP S-malonyltransferase n=1 Tax=Streptomyces griseorubiginosus TaxID=67304 RepID=UPI001FCC8436|nr:ACP S-malonyltransferase [Streptomyces griseorubiginosus]
MKLPSTAPPAAARTTRAFRPVLAMFPGQGSQRPGMARDLVRHHGSVAVPLLERAERALGLPLTEICTSGTAEELAATDVTQPALVATSLVVYEVLRHEGGFAPGAVTGHSLGEYPALVAAGVLDPLDALRLVQVRGRLMAGVCERTPGGMAAVIGLDAAKVEAACRDASAHGLVEVANYNERGQTVVSGEAPAVAAACELARARGAERTVALPVGAPFHCSLMAGLEDEFAAELSRFRFSDPHTPVLSSVTGEWIGSGEHARELLRRQLASPVRWVDVLHTARADGFTDFVEVGPGRVLSALTRRTLPEATVRSTNDARRVAALIDETSHREKDIR